jgi:hypothetical protein
MNFRAMTSAVIVSVLPRTGFVQYEDITDILLAASLKFRWYRSMSSIMQ